MQAELVATKKGNAVVKKIKKQRTVISEVEESWKWQFFAVYKRENML